MLWENLTVEEFKESLKITKGVAIIPIGCLEKHGYHMPLGTDMFIAKNLAIKASEIEPAMVVPIAPYGIISEAQHKIGTLSISSQLQYQILEELCDELARNGYKKIVLICGHGGAKNFINYFVQSRLEKPHPYVVYRYEAHYKTLDQLNEFLKINGPLDGGGHADVMETSEIMHLHPETVHLEKIVVDETRENTRLNELEENGIFTGIWWYAKYPFHIAGNPSLATKEKGKLLEEIYVTNFAKALKIIKDDDLSLNLLEEFYKKCQEPDI